eukprot:TRINITY_DN17814_c0_g1_i1.p1 TRINITY_DN17814_c0_g1~~TRINITY_DN17814_c0_g1_i1.p1  ORF type:complete len:109 (-),score=0.79 TRINITY_DN17814_c0_g1_i1:99-425(-)
MSKLALFLVSLLIAGISADLTLNWNVGSHLTNTIAPGTTVTWQSTDGAPHTVSFSQNNNAPEAIDSGTFSNSAYSITFVTPGTYNYFCAIHPAANILFFFYSLPYLFF